MRLFFLVFAGCWTAAVAPPVAKPAIAPVVHHRQRDPVCAAIRSVLPASADRFATLIAEIEPAWRDASRRTGPRFHSGGKSVIQLEGAWRSRITLDETSGDWTAVWDNDERETFDHAVASVAKCDALDMFEREPARDEDKSAKWHLAADDHVFAIEVKREVGFTYLEISVRMR